MSNRILDYPEAIEITSDDYILLDNAENGAKCIKASALNINMDNYTIKEARGAIASFDDGEDLPLAFMGAYITAIQEGSGDPSPSNVRPISGWDEVNVNRAKVYQICEPNDSTEITANGVTMTYLGKGKYRVKGTLTTNKYTSLNLPIVPFTIYGGDDCYIKLNNSVGLSAVSIIFKNNTSQVDSWGLYPSNRSGSYVGMRNKYTNNIAVEISSSEYGTNFDFTFKVEILSNSTANLSTYNISFGSAGTVYGGKVDLVSGVLTVTHGYVDLGTLDWQYSSISERFYVGATDLGVKATDASTPFNAISSALIAKSYNEIEAKTVDYVIGINPNATQLFARYSSITSASDFKTAMDGVQLVYELATPLTYQLTPQIIYSLIGENNIFADTGDSIVDYRKLWVKPEM